MGIGSLQQCPCDAVVLNLRGEDALAGDEASRARGHPGGLAALGINLRLVEVDANFLEARIEELSSSVHQDPSRAIRGVMLITDCEQLSHGHMALRRNEPLAQNTGNEYGLRILCCEGSGAGSIGT